MPIISVVMPVYNPNNYKQLLESVNSILNQSYQDFELIICDDGSSNEKTQIYLQRIQKLDSRIKIIGYKYNKGAAYSRNQCIKIAKGKFIAFQDDDDISEKSRFEEEVTFLYDNPQYSFVGSNANVFDKNGIWGEYKVPEKPTNNDFLWNSPFINPTMMFRTDVLKSAGGFRVSSETRRGEDYDLFFRLYAAGYRGYNLQKKLFNYRIEIEEEKSKKYLSMKDRISEAKVRYIGFKRLHIGIKAFPYVIKPIIVGLIPHKVFYKIRKKNYS